jgi:hypothetical protein
MKTASDHALHMSVPSILVNLKIADQPQRRRDAPDGGHVEFELSREALQTMLDGLGRIKDQLGSVADASEEAGEDFNSEKTSKDISTLLTLKKNLYNLMKRNFFLRLPPILPFECMTSREIERLQASKSEICFSVAIETIEEEDSGTWRTSGTRGDICFSDGIRGPQGGDDFGSPKFIGTSRSSIITITKGGRYASRSVFEEQSIASTQVLRKCLYQRMLQAGHKRGDLMTARGYTEALRDFINVGKASESNLLSIMGGTRKRERRNR